MVKTHVQLHSVGNGHVCVATGFCWLRRRFQPVYILEPSEMETLDILKGLAERYERHHHCCYSEEALEAAVKLSHKYIADRFLPDKVNKQAEARSARLA